MGERTGWRRSNRGNAAFLKTSSRKGLLIKEMEYEADKFYDVDVTLTCEVLMLSNLVMDTPNLQPILDQ